MIKLGQPPVDKSQLSLFVVNHDIVGLYITMHDTIRVAVIQRLQELKNVVSNVIIGQRWIQNLEIRIVDVFKDERRRLGLWITHNVQELNNVGASAHVLQDFDFTLDFLLFDGLEDFDDAFGVVYYVDAFKDLMRDEK